MRFKVTARTMLHLGSELISSDGVAFYELIKNALDAKSPSVDIEIIQCLPFEIYEEIMRELGEDRETPKVVRDRYLKTLGEDRRDWKELRAHALANIETSAPHADKYATKLAATKTKSGFVDGLRHANRIDFDDEGHGMSLVTLEEVYLTIGTRFRARQRDEAIAANVSPDVQGEKGIGRLSAMRLGELLLVRTGREGDKHWNDLEIDWNDFADAQEDDLTSVDVAAETGREKELDEQGTLIRIHALKSDWSEEKVHQMALEQFSKLTDPLDSGRQLPISLAFNGQGVEIPRFADFLLDEAHGYLSARFEVDTDEGPRVSGSMEYRRYRRQRSFSLDKLALNTMSGFDVETLRRVGPFKLEVYWFNRRVLTKIEGIGNLQVVRRMLAEWAGGVSVYRDGFRVNPYGGPNDDWLDLDRDAFSTTGFKLNRGQIIGRVTIGSGDNPYLIDQTNREGLKDNSEKRAFKEVVAGIMEMYRQYLVAIENDETRAHHETSTTALRRFESEDEKLLDLLPKLDAILGDSKEARALKKEFEERIQELRAAAAIVHQVGRNQEVERGRVFHLAGIGLMIEALAHELLRATSAGLATIADARKSKDERSTQSSLRVLSSQLRTLQKRLKVLDPLSTNARQVKEEFDLVGWIEEIVEGYARRNESRGIRFFTTIVPDGGHLRVKAVKGMFVQVIENLLANSMFWIDAQHKLDVKAGIVEEDGDELIGSIEVRIDLDERLVTVSDTGPGIPEDRRDLVFEPFFSTKKQKAGKGLGLHIAREIAEYHDGQLTLGEADDDGIINSVILDFGSIVLDEQ